MIKMDCPIEEQSRRNEGRWTNFRVMYLSEEGWKRTKSMEMNSVNKNQQSVHHMHLTQQVHKLTTDRLERKESNPDFVMRLNNERNYISYV